MGQANKRFLPFFLFCLQAFPQPASPLQGIVINEIDYAPRSGDKLEFIELHNPSPLSVSMDGWILEGGIRFEFPEGAALLGGEYLVVARSPRDFVRRFGLEKEEKRVFGPFQPCLDDGGSTVILATPSGAIVDRVDYDDKFPWDTLADGRGGSLERICPSVSSAVSYNFRADPSGPTPLAPNHLQECPPPAPPVPLIAINEIHYHPANDADGREEFVELLNTTDFPLDLGGYFFDQGIHFQIPEGTAIAPRGFLVVCRNLAAAQAALEIQGPAVGDFEGQLDNGGERVTLYNSLGEPVDSVRYSDRGDWPTGADGMGRSLERISPEAPGDDPASWMASAIDQNSQWRHVSVTGPATSSVLYLYLQGAGETLVDDVRVEDPSKPDTNLMPNGSFDAGIEGWTTAGNHLDSGWQSDGGIDGSGALRVVANGVGNGPLNGITYRVNPPLTFNATYRFSLSYKHVAGDPGLMARFSGASLTRGLYIDVRSRPVMSAGLPNSVAREKVPPFLSRLARTPLEPKSSEATKITVVVRGSGIRSVSLEYWQNFKPESAGVLEMGDDGLHGDGMPRDGVFGAEVPPFPHNTAVTFRIRAEDENGGSRELPPSGDPTGVLGYYVNDDQPSSPLPVFHILINHTSAANPVSLLRALNCQTYQNAAFAFQGDLYSTIGIRQRGQSVCGSQKPYLKLRFQHGRDFQSRRKINLQSLWTDKALVREHFAWDFFREMESPYCTTRHVRLHVNGKYFGLYEELEHPDADFLERNGLNPQGNLYKAVASRDEKMTRYEDGWEKKTNENGDFSDLKTFLDTMNTIPRTQLRGFWENNIVPDSVIDYQACQVLTNNRDYPHKNHYLYHDTEGGLWRTITWDMDLTFGKYWDGSNGGVLNDRMDVPGITPWYTTRVAGEGIGNYLLDRFFYDTPDKYYQRALRVRLWIALREKYTLPLFDVKIQRMRDLLMEEQDEDLKKWGRSAATANDPTAPRDFLPNLERVRAHIQARRTYLSNYLTNVDKLSPPDRVKITEVMYHPWGSEELEFLELYNPSGKAIDISGWTIQGIEYRFPPGSQLQDGEVLVVAKSPEFFKEVYGEGIRTFGPYSGDLDDQGEEIRVRDAGPGYPATIDVLRYSSAPPWPGLAGGLGRSFELTEVTADRDNDPPENWRASVLPGGTPGRIPGLAIGIPFRRGNCDGSGSVNISDAIFLIGILYLGLPLPPCPDGCDATGDRELDIADAAVLLRYLFLGEEGIPEPGPLDCKAQEGSFCEATNCPPPG